MRVQAGNAGSAGVKCQPGAGRVKAGRMGYRHADSLRISCSTRDSIHTLLNPPLHTRVLGQNADMSVDLSRQTTPAVAINQYPAIHQIYITPQEHAQQAIASIRHV